MVGIGPVNQIEPVDLHRARRQLHRLAAPRQVVGALALDLDCGEAGRHLLDPTDEARQQGGDLGARRAQRAGREHLALGVVGGARLAQAGGEAVVLAPFHDVRDGLGRLAQGQRQHAGRQRVEGAAVADLARLVIRRTRLTAAVEVIPSGLSRHSQPWIGCPVDLARAIVVLVAAHRRALLASRASMCAASANERSGPERQIRRVFEPHASRHLAAQLRGDALQRLQALRAQLPPSSVTNTTAWRRSGLMRTSDTVKRTSASPGSRQ